MIDLKGIMTALVTPLNENGTLNERELTELIEFQISKGINSILLLGGTGEYTSMSYEERCKVVDAGVKAVNGRLPVVVGVLDTGIGEALKFSRYCKKAGTDALLVCTPYYNVGTQEALIEYYITLDKEVDMPILVYNIPYRTNVNIMPSTMETLVGKMKNLVGIKECAALGQAIELYLKVGGKINVLSGSESCAPALMMMGFDGAVMATANLVPDIWVKIYDAAQKSDVQKANELLLKYTPLFNAIFSENYIGPLKHAMIKAGLPCGMKQMLPLVDPSENAIKLVEKEMKNVGFVF